MRSRLLHDDGARTWAVILETGLALIRPDAEARA